MGEANRKTKAARMYRVPALLTVALFACIDGPTTIPPGGGSDSGTPGGGTPNGGVCLPGGICATPSDVVYADSQAQPTETACSQTAPCVLSVALATQKPYIVLHGDFTEPVVIANRKLWLLAERGTASLGRPDSGPVVKATKNADLTLYGIEIRDAVQSETVGISAEFSTVTGRQITVSKMSGLGIDITGGKLILTDSSIEDNRAGGVRVSNATFQLTNDLFTGNGTQQAAQGAIYIAAKASPDNKLESCMVSNNMAQDGVGAGVQCYVGDFVGHNNQIQDNGTGNSDASVQITGNCSFVQ